uniref:Uncharacterized protein n=1 Tax=Anguilla anguilla TaxID=7936 RepID=A0A0E9WLJ0_ANGAN
MKKNGGWDPGAEWEKTRNSKKLIQTRLYKKKQNKQRTTRGIKRKLKKIQENRTTPVQKTNGRNAQKHTGGNKVRNTNRSKTQAGTYGLKHKSETNTGRQIHVSQTNTRNQHPSQGTKNLNRQGVTRHR